MAAPLGLRAELLDIAGAVEQLDQAGIGQVDTGEHDGVLGIDAELQRAGVTPQAAQRRFEQGTHAQRLPNLGPAASSVVHRMRDRRAGARGAWTRLSPAQLVLRGAQTTYG